MAKINYVRIYHGTSYDNAIEILNHGFKKDYHNQNAFVTTDKQWALKRYAYERDDEFPSLVSWIVDYDDLESDDCKDTGGSNIYCEELNKNQYIIDGSLLDNCQNEGILYKYDKKLKLIKKIDMCNY